MRLTQLDDRIIIENKASKKPAEEDLADLKEIMQEMHKTMLVADRIMRRLELILEKY